MTEQKREYNRNYYAEHKEQHKEAIKKYYEKHKKELYEKHKEYHAKWQREHYDKVKASKAKYYKKLALHKKRVKQAKFQLRDEKGRFCKWEDKPLNYLPALRLLTAIALYK